LGDLSRIAQQMHAIGCDPKYRVTARNSRKSSMTRMSMLIAVFAVMVTAVVNSGDEDSTNESTLEAAKSQFGESIARARDDLSEHMRTQATYAQKAGDLKTLEKIEGEIKAFESSSRLPISVSSKGYATLIQNSRKKMLVAYSAAVKQFTKAGKLTEAKATQNEHDQFKTNEKAVPLGPQLGDELLKSPGCEEPRVNGNIPGWVTAQGRWAPQDHGSWVGFHNGSKHNFYAGNVLVGELYQDVDMEHLGRAIDAGNSTVVMTWLINSHRSCPFCETGAA